MVRQRLRLGDRREISASDILLQRNDLGEDRISDIAFDGGINDRSCFNRGFRRCFALTPSAARVG
jgi:AraC-like DNA-binding protein